jgi:hypothetical protein
MKNVSTTVNSGTGLTLPILDKLDPKPAQEACGSATLAKSAVFGLQKMRQTA